VWLLVSAWATSFVMRQDVPSFALRLFYFALVWLVPFLGAAFVIVVLVLGSHRAESSANEKMFQAIAEKKGELPPDTTVD